MQTLCLFNHKGGVSKTTTAFNLGWAFADRGKRVLLVDLDSQCNLTGLVMGYNSIDDDHMENFYANREYLTMDPIVTALIDGRTPDDFLQVDRGKVITVASRNDDRLMLLAGHLSVSELDAQISVSLKIASGVPATRNIPGNLPKIIRLIAEKNDIDYIIFDLSPNVGGLNEVILMSCDYFIVPTAPDFFCLQAVGSLQRHIGKWHNDIMHFRTLNNFSGKDYPIPGKPVFLGTIQQRYRPRKDRPTFSFEKWISLIRTAINEKLVPSLRTIDCCIDEKSIMDVLAGTDLEPYDLAQISDFNSLIAISQQLSKPIFAITDDELRTIGEVFGHAFNTMKTSRTNFAGIFEGLADRLLRLMA